VFYNYILHEHAQEDYETSLKWYAERSEQAAKNFITAVDDALQLICAHPARWRNTYKNYHELGLKKYPFTIIYSIETNKQLIVVFSIYHHKRNPKKKYKK
jgi:plasmid stabilization system protein ParE